LAGTHTQAATGAGIGRQDELEIRGEPHRPIGTGDGHHPIFQGFPQGLEDVGAEFRSLVQEKRPEMG
jgi:hypothetical protein